jgi:predicted glycosyltransferase involved in capsule biosynthesis
MSDLSIIIPFRATDEFRLANLRKVVDFLKLQLPQADFVIFEQDTQTKLEAQLPLSNSCLHLYADGGAFNKSKLINLAVQRAASDILLISDADIVVSHEGLHRSIDAVRKELHFVRPFENLVDLDLEQSQAFLREKSLPTEVGKAKQSNRRQYGEALCLAGGVFVIRKSTYLELGGFDERFLGWGGEDNAFSELVTHQVSKSAVLKDGVAWHLWHPREDTRQSAHYQRNRELLKEYALLRGTDSFEGDA